MILKTGRLGLPQEIVCRILELICDEYEPEGIKIMVIILDELHNIVLSCPDFLAALPHCYKYLAAKLDPLPGSDKRDWDEIVANPNLFKAFEIKEALRDAELLNSGSKAGVFLIRQKERLTWN
jgi:hypothetical protein